MVAGASSSFLPMPCPKTINKRNPIQTNNPIVKVELPKRNFSNQDFFSSSFLFLCNLFLYRFVYNFFYFWSHIIPPPLQHVSRLIRIFSNNQPICKGQKNRNNR
ncbi:Cell wall-associated glycosyl hydrolase [Bacillus cereus BDRD-ST26]|nr:Cell wall-associated glycosyl hydrolase [Bacillus cereus BDRD-ST26]